MLKKLFLFFYFTYSLLQLYRSNLFYIHCDSILQNGLPYLDFND